MADTREIPGAERDRRYEVAHAGLMEILRRGIEAKNAEGTFGVFAGGHQAGLMAAAAVAEQALKEIHGNDWIDATATESDHGRSLRP